MRITLPRSGRRPPADGGGRGPARRSSRAATAALLSRRRWPTPSGPSIATAGERAILVINRRGTASVVLCRDCGYVQVCPECQRPLVFHAAGMALRCHHCGATAPPASRCPACASARIRYLGGGTERVEREVADALPGPARRPTRPRRGRAEGGGGPRRRRLRRRRAGRPRRHQPGDQGPRRPRGRRWSASSRPTSPSTCPTSAPPNAPTSSCARRSVGPAAGARPGRAHHPDLPARPPRHPGRRRRRRGDRSTTPSWTRGGGSASPPFGRSSS